MCLHNFVMFVEKIRRLNGSHITTIFKGNFISKFVLVIGGLLLAKYYGASEYGLFSIYLSIAGIISVLISFAQEHIVILEKEEDEVSNNFTSSGVISFLAMFLCFLVLFIPFGISKSIIFFGIFTGYLLVFTNNSKFLLARKKKFKIVSLLTMTDAVVSFIFQVVFVFIKIENGLIIGSFIGFLASFIASLIFTKEYLTAPNLNRYIKIVKSRMILLKYTYPSNFINSLGNNLMPLLISFYFANNLLGEYTLAVKIISVPLLMISSSIAVVYYPRAAEINNVEKDTDKLFRYTKKMSLLNFYIILALYLMINIIGIPVLQLIFNKGWDHLGQFIFLMSFGFLARSLINPVADILIILNKNKIAFFFNIYLLAANLAALYMGWEKGIMYLVSVFSALLLLGYGFLYLYILSIFKKNESYQKNN